ncbi:MAG: hypothetical protein M5U23_13250 [Acidimicrobiia bacterium]|nr:hypothetical protein [Acidimicrobiia bacterium]
MTDRDSDGCDENGDHYGKKFLHDLETIPLSCVFIGREEHKRFDWLLRYAAHDVPGLPGCCLGAKSGEIPTLSRNCDPPCEVARAPPSQQAV